MAFFILLRFKNRLFVIFGWERANQCPDRLRLSPRGGAGPLPERAADLLYYNVCFAAS